MSPTEIEVQESLSFGLQIKKTTLDKSGDGTAGFILLQNPASAPPRPEEAEWCANEVWNKPT